MSQLSAYNLLEGFAKQNEVEVLSYSVNFLRDVNVIEVDPVQSKFNQNDVLNNKFLYKHLCTCNSFIQLFQKSTVSTEIATMGVPFAPELNEIDFKNQDQVYKNITKNLKDSFTIFEIQHNSTTISISFCEELDSFCISYGTQTIICYDEKDIELNKNPKHDQLRQVATSFFNLFNKMPRQQQNNFIEDLTNRSLVGCYNHKKQIEWFAILEHYAEQRMINPYTVQGFLHHYKLEPIQIYQTQCTQFQLQKHFSQIYNQLIDQFNDFYKGKTLYFWKGDLFLGCCFIPFKQYIILNELQSIIMNKEKEINKKEPFQYLSNFNLNDQDLEFYKKYTEMMLDNSEDIKNTFQFSKLTTQAFNSIKADLDYLSKKQQGLIPLSYCMQSAIIVVIPIGISGMGYEKLCLSIQKTCLRVQIIKLIDQINEKNQLYFIEKICNPKELEQVNKQIKSLPFNIKTVALLPECQSTYEIKEWQCSFPFSFNFIMHCLLSVLDNKNSVKEIINQLKEFQNEKLYNIQTDYKIKCRFIDDKKEKNDLYSEIVEQDFQAALKSQNDQLIESLSQYKDALTNMKDNHLQRESKRLITTIEERTYIILRKSVKFQFEKDHQLKYGLFIEKPDWVEIDKFVKSCLEIIVQEYPNDSVIKRMYHQFDSQFKAQNAVFMRISQPYLKAKQLQEKPITTKVSIAVIIVDGIVMLQPQELGMDLLQDIPIYTHNIDNLKSNKVSEQVKLEVKKMQKQNIEDNTIKKKQVSFNGKDWDAFIVKFTPINIRLIGRQIN
ncbi:unnamed protein product (macronuclear) [Paramecium tetraurelia]|uniref:Uncharacterized protein n=1 Tax=Paramecium tetraurelia TaxID=5888 RepID=A0BSM5_PARTE|nr:uncharacterized protein GSPATT00031774001 [Paramecium tetraurelia]CAK61542.1 unnamed protein product [Paramecium tetraurelia]|eukprot:XP_001428940.1 hypothetical protein (macronuclear) [Paramecium tetraurelia strain d4-2]